MRCPNCQSENTQFITNSTSKGPSFFRGCCGWLIFGPMGILCSFCGIKAETEEYWICNSCGSKFQAGDYARELESKVKRVTSLKQDIASLESELMNKPINLQQLLNEAKIEYDNAQKIRRDFDADFINSSKTLKIMNTINNIIIVVALLIFIFGIWLGLSLLGDGGLFLALVATVVAIVMYGIADTIFKKVKRSVDSEKAEYLSMLEAACDTKKKRYDDLQKIKRKEDTYKQKINELTQAEQDLHKYSNK